MSQSTLQPNDPQSNDDRTLMNRILTHPFMLIGWGFVFGAALVVIIFTITNNNTIPKNVENCENHNFHNFSIILSTSTSTSSPSVQLDSSTTNTSKAVAPTKLSKIYYNVFTKRSLQTACFKLNSVGSCNVHSNLTISGLWPQLVHLNANVTNCLNNPNMFNETELIGLSNLTERLSLAWREPIFSNKSSMSFWSAQWSKHGTCSAFNMTRYFENILYLNQKYPINQFLAQSNITANNEIEYSLTQIQSALNAHIKPNQYILNCIEISITEEKEKVDDEDEEEEVKIKSKTKSAFKQLLDSVQLCVTYWAPLRLIKCPYITSSCTGESSIWFLSSAEKKFASQKNTKFENIVD